MNNFSRWFDQICVLVTDVQYCNVHFLIMAINIWLFITRYVVISMVATLIILIFIQYCNRLRYQYIWKQLLLWNEHPRCYTPCNLCFRVKYCIEIFVNGKFSFPDSHDLWPEPKEGTTIFPVMRLCVDRLQKVVVLY